MGKADAVCVLAGGRRVTLQRQVGSGFKHEQLRIAWQ
jgi:hypothetical protein